MANDEIVERGVADGRRQAPKAPAWRKIIPAVLVMAALALAWRYTPLSEYLTAQRVAGWARAVRTTPWAPFALVLAYTPAAFVLFPRPLLTLVAVLAFGPWRGFGYAMSGVLIAALACYGLGRRLSPRSVQRIAGRRFDPVVRVIRGNGLLAVLGMSIVPVAPFAVEGIIVGALRVRLWQYLVGTFLGMAPGMLATTVFSHQLATALDDPSRLNYGLIAAVLAVFAVMTALVWRWFSRAARPAT
jgi:uncharacterized membrane protein YdjX (TVP38/TMEM64 family)